jgi:hypothetical protein
MTAIHNSSPRKAELSLQSLIHQALKKIWLATMGIRPTACVPLASPNPGEQAWVISPAGLGTEPLVYSLGLSENLSFDLGMIQQHGAKVHGFDPTKESVMVANCISRIFRSSMSCGNSCFTGLHFSNIGVNRVSL